jgi:cell division septal protein FtsQ
VIAIVATVAAMAIGLLVYRLAFAGSGGGADRTPAKVRATAVIGSGSDAVGVSAKGVILSGRPAPADGKLPRLPLDTAPRGGHLAGPMLQQARVLGAAPAALRPCVEGSYYGTSGVDVNLYAGIELRFGSAARAAQKWSAAAAVLADPSTTGIGYVDLHSPTHVSTGGTGPSLPPPEPGAGTGCGE